MELVKERDHLLKRLFEITILSLPANGPVNDHLVTSTFPGEGNEEDPGKKLLKRRSPTSVCDAECEKNFGSSLPLLTQQPY